RRRSIARATTRWQSSTGPPSASRAGSAVTRRRWSTGSPRCANRPPPRPGRNGFPTKRQSPTRPPAARHAWPAKRTRTRAMAIAEFAYAQARLQARHARSPDGAAWQLLEASHTAAHYLAQARSGPLAWWVEGLDDARDAHRIEHHAQARWQLLVNEVAGWLPRRWQPATQW